MIVYRCLRTFIKEILVVGSQYQHVYKCFHTNCSETTRNTRRNLCRHSSNRRIGYRRLVLIVVGLYRLECTRQLVAFGIACTLGRVDSVEDSVRCSAVHRSAAFRLWHLCWRGRSVGWWPCRDLWRRSSVLKSTFMQCAYLNVFRVDYGGNGTLS